MTTKMLQLTPLTAPAFQPFGDVISVETSQSVELINRGHTQRFNQPTELARPSLGLCLHSAFFAVKAGNSRFQLRH